jgi:hypothetical protein
MWNSEHCISYSLETQHVILSCVQKCIALQIKQCNMYYFTGCLEKGPSNWPEKYIIYWLVNACKFMDYLLFLGW